MTIETVIGVALIAIVVVMLGRLFFSRKRNSKNDQPAITPTVSMLAPEKPDTRTHRVISTPPLHRGDAEVLNAVKRPPPPAQLRRPHARPIATRQQPQSNRADDEFNSMVPGMLIGAALLSATSDEPQRTAEAGRQVSLNDLSGPPPAQTQRGNSGDSRSVDTGHSGGHTQPDQSPPTYDPGGVSSWNSD